MLIYSIWHIKHLKNYFNDERNLYVNKFDFEISKIKNKKKLLKLQEQ